MTTEEMLKKKIWFFDWLVKFPQLTAYIDKCY